MPRVTNAAQAARRALVAPLWLKGVPLSGIAATVGCDWQTAQRDVALLGKQAARELCVERELARLLLAGRAVEAAAWESAQGALVLAAQRQQLTVLQVLRDRELAQRVEALEARLEAITLAQRGGAAQGGAGPALSHNGRVREGRLQWARD